jgi:hypothetical protein
MPDNRRTGYIEHFIATMIVAEDKLWPRAQSCVEQIPEEERRYPPAHSDKVRIPSDADQRSEVMAIGIPN